MKIMGSFGTLSRSIGRTLLAVGATLAALGCGSQIGEYALIQTGTFPEPWIFNDALDWTERGSKAFTTLQDFDAAKEAAYGSMGQLEGLHRLVPEDQNGL